MHNVQRQRWRLADQLSFALFLLFSLSLSPCVSFICYGRESDYREKINHEHEATAYSTHSAHRVDKQQILIQCTAHHLHINWTVFRGKSNERLHLSISNALDHTTPHNSLSIAIFSVYFSLQFTSIAGLFFNLPLLVSTNALFIHRTLITKPILQWAKRKMHLVLNEWFQYETN